MEKEVKNEEKHIFIVLALLAFIFIVLFTIISTYIGISGAVIGFIGGAQGIIAIFALLFIVAGASIALYLKERMKPMKD